MNNRAGVNYYKESDISALLNLLFGRNHAMCSRVLVELQQCKNSKKWLKKCPGKCAVEEYIQWNGKECLKSEIFSLIDAQQVKEFRKSV